MKKNILLATAFAAFLTSAGAFQFMPSEETGTAALVQLSGAISTSSGGAFSSSGITPEEVRNRNEKVREQGYDAVIYEINSGGGTVVASKEIMRSINSMEIPTVCRFRDVAASGAYLFSLGCDRIVSDNSTLTGSIGVKSSYLEFSDALEEYGIDYVNTSSGRYKELGSPYVDPSDNQTEILASRSRVIHEQFLDLVDSKRNISNTSMSRIETGNVFVGETAAELGLVDRLGGREVAKNVSESLVGRDLSFQKLEKEESFSLFSLPGLSSVISALEPEVPIEAAL
mgnify:CR=1 FL=1